MNRRHALWLALVWPALAASLALAASTITLSVEGMT